MESANELEESQRHLITAGRLVALFFLIYILSSLCRTPGSWPDGRSRWMPQLLFIIISIPILISVHWIYARTERKYKIQATALWAVFRAITMFAIVHLFSSQSSLEDFGFAGPFDYLRSPTKFLNAPWGNF